MKYINANEILPDVLVKELQNMSKQDIFIFQLRANSINLGVNCLVIGKSLKDAIKLSLKNTAEVFLLRNLRTNIIFRYML